MPIPDHTHASTSAEDVPFTCSCGWTAKDDERWWHLSKEGEEKLLSFLSTAGPAAITATAAAMSGSTVPDTLWYGSLSLALDHALKGSAKYVMGNATSMSPIATFRRLGDVAMGSGMSMYLAQGALFLSGQGDYTATLIPASVATFGAGVRILSLTSGARKLRFEYKDGVNEGSLGEVVVEEEEVTAATEDHAE